MKERLRTKASPGPVSPLLLEPPKDGPRFGTATIQFERVKPVVQSNRGRNLSLEPIDGRIGWPYGGRIFVRTETLSHLV